MKQLIKRKKVTHNASPPSPPCLSITTTPTGRGSLLGGGGEDGYSQQQPPHHSLLSPAGGDAYSQVGGVGSLRGAESVLPTSADLFLNKESILKGLEDGVFVQQKAPDDWTSDVWKSFNLVYSITHGVTNYCICKHCGRIYSYKSKGKLTGTRNLKDHLSSSTGCKKQFTTEKQAMINHCSVRETANNHNSNNKERNSHNHSSSNLVAEACIRLCVEDFLPFELIEGTGFQQFTRHLIKLGNPGNSAALDDAHLGFPSPVHVFQTVHRVYNGIVFEVTKVLHKRLQIPDGLFSTAMSLEFRKESLTHYTYFAASLHYIDDNWSYVNRCIAFSLFDFCELAVDQFLRDSFLSILQDRYRVDLTNTPLRFTLEKDFEVPPPFQGVNCACHILHTVLTQTFMDEVSGIDPRVLNLISLANRVLKKIREWGNQTYLPPSLKKCSHVRWNAVYSVLKFIQRSSDEFYGLLEMHGDEEELSLLNAVRSNMEDSMLLNKLIEVLKCFKDMMKLLQSSSEPTLYLVWFVKYELIKTIKLMSFSDTIQPAMKSFNDRLVANLETYFVFDKVHQAARFLHPLSKSLKGTSSEERSAVLEDVRTYMRVVERHSAFVGISSSNQQTIKCLEMIDTCDQQVLDLPSVHFSQRAAGTLSVEDELSLYEAYQLQVYDMSTYLREAPKEAPPGAASPPPYVLFDCLKWWMNNQYMFPRLAIVARYLLATPASSVCLRKSPNEVVLALEKHACLSSSLESVILCHHNSDLFDRFLTSPLTAFAEKPEF